MAHDPPTRVRDRDTDDGAPRIVLVRGLNVGRSKRMTMARLRDVWTAAGCTRVTTHLQSGNAVVTAPVGVDDETLRHRLSESLASEFAATVHVWVLTAREVRRIVDDLPFPEAADDPRSLHAFFLDGTATPNASVRLTEVAGPRERFDLRDRVLYLHAPDGIGRSKLAAGAERMLGTPTTARNWRSVTALLDLAEA